jgi:hypothetical protein
MQMMPGSAMPSSRAAILTLALRMSSPSTKTVAGMDTDAPFHSALASNVCALLRYQLLQRNHALDGADHRAELDQHAVAGGLDDAPATPTNSSERRAHGVWCGRATKAVRGFQSRDGRARVPVARG